MGHFCPLALTLLLGLFPYFQWSLIIQYFLLFSSKKTNPSAASSPEMSYFTASIRWKMPENIIKIERQKIPIV